MLSKQVDDSDIPEVIGSNFFLGSMTLNRD